MNRSTGFRITLLSIMTVIAVGCAESDPTGSPKARGTDRPLDSEQLEWIEDLSESLANDLLDLSVASRQQNRRVVEGYFAEALQATPFPIGDEETKPKVKWVSETSWPVATTPGSLSRDEFLSRWDTFFGRFETIEDVRFKVKKADFVSETSGEARVYFYLVGRNQAGQREWVRGYLNGAATRDQAESGEDPIVASTSTWRFESFVFEYLKSTLSEVDLFSEVAGPAGLAVELPRYGSPGNEGFVWHGAAAADVDNDGDIDLFSTGVGRNYLYLNRGDGTFAEAASNAGLAKFLEPGVAPVFSDIDNDGDVDLFVTAVGKQMLFENQFVPAGELAFYDVSVSSGVDRDAFGFSASAGDVNGDGYPDLFVASYNRYGVVMPNNWHAASNGTPNLLFLNQGDGTFKESATEWGLTHARWSYAAHFVDLDQDHDLDLYVANDFGHNSFYRNDGGRFVDVASDLGISDPGNGMGVSFGDYDNDGDLDLHVTNMSSTAGNRILGRLYSKPAGNDAGKDPETEAIAESDVLYKLASGNSLYEQLDDGTWRDVTAAAGGFSSGWAWGGGFLDFDNDGWEDVFSPNGFVSGKLMKDT